LNKKGFFLVDYNNNVDYYRLKL